MSGSISGSEDIEVSASTSSEIQERSKCVYLSRTRRGRGGRMTVAVTMGGAQGHEERGLTDDCPPLQCGAQGWDDWRLSDWQDELDGQIRRGESTGLWRSSRSFLFAHVLSGRAQGSFDEEYVQTLGASPPSCSSRFAS